MTDLCSVCHREGVPVYAKGLCRNDYKKDLKERQEAKREATWSPSPGPDSDALGQVDPGSTVLGDDQDAGVVTDSAYMPPPSQGERPPVEGRTPSPSRAGAGSGEVPPQAPTSKFKAFFSKKEKSASPSGGPLPASREKRPGGGKSGRRESAAETIADGWAALGGLAASTSAHAPLGRLMQWQAPVAGEMLDEAVKGSIVDKVALQRIVKARGRFDLVGAVFGPPLLVLAIERNPQQVKTLMPILAAQIRRSLPLMVPAIKKAQAKEKAVMEATELLFEDDPNWKPGTDPVEYILGMMFAGWVPPGMEEVPTEATPEPTEVVV